MFPYDKTAEELFAKSRWGGQPTYCPLCGCCEKIKQVLSREPLPYRCGSCRRNFSVKSRNMGEYQLAIQKINFV